VTQSDKSVWVLVDQANNEGGEVCGVYSSLEAARAAGATVRGFGPSGGRIEAIPMTIDAPVPEGLISSQVIRDYASARERAVRRGS